MTRPEPEVGRHIAVMAGFGKVVKDGCGKLRPMRRWRRRTPTTALVQLGKCRFCTAAKMIKLLLLKGQWHFRRHVCIGAARKVFRVSREARPAINARRKYA
jgi:hypothetical protein